MEGSGEMGGTSSMGVGAGGAMSSTSLGADFKAETQVSAADFEAETAASVDVSQEQTDFSNGQSLDEFVATPGSAHDKLVALSQMPDPEVPVTEEVPEANQSVVDAAPEKEQLKNPLETDEQKVMRLQRETMELMAKRLASGQSNETDKELKELLAQLKFLMEKLGNNGERAGLTASALALLLLFLDSGAKAEQKFENEVKRA